MAIAVSSDFEAPQHVTVSRYAVERLGPITVIQVDLSETVDDTEAPVIVQGLLAADRLVIPEWTSRTDMVGRPVFLGKDQLGVITGIYPANGSNPAAVILSEPVLNSIIGKKVMTSAYNSAGNLSHRPSKGGRQWTLRLPMHGAGALRAQQMMVSAHVRAVRAVLDALGDTTRTNLQIQAAVVSVSQSGNSLDSILASEAENLELDRQAGRAPYLQVIGAAPQV